MPHHTLSWAKGKELRRICVLTGANTATGRFGWGRSIYSCFPISWLRESHTGKSCVDWDKHLRLLSNLILKGSRKTTPKCGSEFYTSYTFCGKIYVVLDKGMWKKSGIALEAPTGLNGSTKSYLGPPCPWSRAPFKSLGLSFPAVVMLQQCCSMTLLRKAHVWAYPCDDRLQGRSHCFEGM